MLDRNFWKRYFKTYDLLNSAIPYQELLDDISSLLGVSLGDKVLDAGSGTGNLSIKLKREGAEVQSIDFSQEGINLHKKKDSQAKVSVHDLTNELPFEDSFFDGIVSNNVIYTIEPSRRGDVFNEFYRVLKPGGLIVIADVKKGFMPIAIFFDHIKKAMKAKGITPTLFDFFKYFSVVVKVFYYNYLIKKENKKGSYSFLQKGEHGKLLTSAGFDVVGQTKTSYSGQSYIDIGRKV